MRKLATIAAMTALLVFAGAGFLNAKAFVLPHVLEKSGLITNTQQSFDTTIFATYTPGLTGVGTGSGAIMDLYLYDATGSATMKNHGADVCNPCTFAFGTAPNAGTRKQTIRMDDLIRAATADNSFDSVVKLGFGVIVVRGDDPDGVNIQGFVVNSHTNAFDLSVFGFEPQPITAAP